MALTKIPEEMIDASAGSADEVLTTDGTDATWEAAGGGKVLQIVYTSNSTEATSTSSSYANTAHTVTITPAGTSSKILVGVSFSAGIERASTTEANGIYKLRNTTDSADLVEAVYQVNATSGALGMWSSQTLIGVDTGRADATVYYLQYKSDGTSEIYVNNSNDPGQMWAIEFSS
tara:strand:+ start:100 stop:624 length:525 start_codon:yes stop_codon:yes gene_type:complete